MSQRQFTLLTIFTCLSFALCALASVSKEDADNAVRDAQSYIDDAFNRGYDIDKRVEEVQSAVSDFFSKKTRLTEVAKKDAAEIARKNALAKTASERAKKAEEEFKRYSGEEFKIKKVGIVLQSTLKVIAAAIGEIFEAQKMTSSDNDYTAKKQKAEEIKQKVSEKVATFESTESVISTVQASLEKAKTASDTTLISKHHAEIMNSILFLKIDLGVTEGSLRNALRTESDKRVFVKKMEKVISKLSADKAEKAQSYLTKSQKALQEIPKQVSICNNAAEKIRELLQETESIASSMESETSVEAASEKVKEAELNQKSTKPEIEKTDAASRALAFAAQDIINAAEELRMDFGITDQQIREEKDDSDAVDRKKQTQSSFESNSQSSNAGDNSSAKEENATAPFDDTKSRSDSVNGNTFCMLSVWALSVLLFMGFA